MSSQTRRVRSIRTGVASRAGVRVTAAVVYSLRAMANSMPVLVAPSSFGGEVRAPVVAAAIARGLERAGVTPPPDVCPVSGGGQGLVEVLLPALGGETGDGFALIDGGGTALVELASSARETGARVARAVAAGVEVVVVGAGGGDVAVAVAGGGGGTRGGGGGRGGAPGSGAPGSGAPGSGAPGGGVPGGGGSGGGGAHGGGGSRDGWRRVIAAVEEGGGLRGATLVVLCETKAAWPGRDVGDLRRDPRGVPMTAAGDGLAGVLWAHYGARLVSGPQFVLEELGFDARMRAARAVIVGDACLDAGTLQGRVAGEIAVRARQAGVPCHAIVGVDAIDPFDARILDLQMIVEASTIAGFEAAGERVAQTL
jgi:glycerate 2-kinase